MKVSCPHGDFGAAPGRLGQSRALGAHYESPRRHGPASDHPAIPAPQAPLRERRGASAAPSQPRPALAATVAAQAPRPNRSVRNINAPSRTFLPLQAAPGLVDGWLRSSPGYSHRREEVERRDRHLDPPPYVGGYAGCEKSRLTSTATGRSTVRRTCLFSRQSACKDGVFPPSKFSSAPHSPQGDGGGEMPSC